MTPAPKTYELTLSRTIAATPEEVYDAWLDPALPCNPWSGAIRIDWQPREGALWYFLRRMEKEEPLDRPHFGRFRKLVRGQRIELDWMSYNTRGLESTVTVTLKAQGDDTLFVLKHANIPDDDLGQGHERGWAALTTALEKLLSERKPA